jgi:hypothetical protein
MHLLLRIVSGSIIHAQGVLFAKAFSAYVLEGIHG